jgi:dTDP-4-dehydrorhamnose 3,5-epimerase
MGEYDFRETGIEGVIVVTPRLFGDARGGFMETYTEKDFRAAGVTNSFVQDNQSFSVRGVLRGLHYQRRHPQAKLVRALVGEVFDVAVDLRPGSETYGRWVGELLSAENRRQLLIPRGFAHGFLVLSEQAVFAYKCDEYYHPNDEGGIRWDDPDIGISWPLPPGAWPILSAKDAANPPLLAALL